MLSAELPSLEPVPGEVLDHPDDQKEPRHDLIERTKHCGPAMIGVRQWRLNQKVAKTSAFHGGPAKVMTPQEYEVYRQAGEPKDWTTWLLDHRTVKVEAEKAKSTKIDKAAIEAALKAAAKA